MKVKPKRNPIPKEELAKVEERSGGKCEFHGDDCSDKLHLEYAHIIHRGMGGVQGNRARIINDHRNITKICEFIHDLIDGRLFEVVCSKGRIESITEGLKQKIGWYEWAEENRGVINR